MIFGLFRSDPAACGATRSGRWPAVRAAHLRRQPECQICGGRREIEVHHIVPVHVNASLELAPDNLVTLCRADHWLWGHGGYDWSRWNEDCLLDVMRAQAMRRRVNASA